jgi:hypothetical protein
MILRAPDGRLTPAHLAADGLLVVAGEVYWPNDSCPLAVVELDPEERQELEAAGWRLAQPW